MRDRKGATQELQARWGDAPGKTQHGRLLFLVACTVLVFTIVAARLVQLHLFPGHKLTSEEEYHIGQLILEQPRGHIRDRAGLILAANKRVPSLWVDPRKVEDEAATIEVLTTRLHLAEDDVRKALQRHDQHGNIRKFNMLKRWMDDWEEDDIRAIVDTLPGVHIDLEPIRYYPQKDIASHVLGFVTKSGEYKEGAERRFDQYLQSEPGRYVARKDRDAQLLPSLQLDFAAPEGGADVYLSLDTTIQYSLETSLDRRIEETGAESGMGIVMDPKTGAILALVNRPAFDPNRHWEYSLEERTNYAVTGAFEPGSVFKIVAAAAALEQGLITPTTLINCENGGFNPYGHYIRDFYKLGVEPFTECFAQSSNVAIIKVAGLLGRERFDQWIRAFGFGERTSEHFASESRGVYAGTNFNRLSMGSLPMGQEIAVTMLQLARAFAVIANGGYLVQPYLVEQVLGREGEVVYQHEPLRGTRIISQETAKTMQELCHLVTQTGTGKRASIAEYRVGGKTGTAQISRPEGGYYSDKYNTVFAGFAPVADPQLVAVVVVRAPTIRLRYGGYVAGPVFKEVVGDALRRMNVPEDPVRDPNGKIIVAEDTADTSRTTPKNDQTLEAALEAGLDADTVVEWNALEELERSPHALLESLDGLELIVPSEDHLLAAGGVLPDLRGLSKSQAKERLYRLGIQWDPQGAGWVLEQDPPPGTPLTEVTLCALKFGSKALDHGDSPHRNL